MNRTIGVAIPLALVLLVFLGLIACTTEPTNTNQGSTNAANLATVSAMSSTADPCSAKDIPARLTALQTLLHNPNTDLGDAELNNQRKYTFDIRVDSDGSGGILMRVRGKISREGNPPQLRKLVMFLDKYMKKGCVSRVSFESMTESATASSSPAGFEWSLCGPGMCPTPPNGECQSCLMPANRPGPSPTPSPSPRQSPSPPTPTP